jgi:hypothetical protein
LRAGRHDEIAARAVRFEQRSKAHFERHTWWTHGGDDVAAFLGKRSHDPTR